MEPSTPTSKPTVPIVVALACLVVVGGAAAFYFNRNTGTSVVTPATQEQVTTPTTPTDNPASTPVDTPVSTNTSGYKDGTYSATGTYRTPQTTEQINVSLTLKDGIVTDATVTGDPQVKETVRFQGFFIANFKQQVIGKNIDTLLLSHVSGSSLTSGGFNAAVAKIKTQAKS